ncbi:MAG: ABC transporter permease [Chitinophagaceae bacterium]|nr:ABC transporter permease [Chitinophagaceae bacterium]MBP6590489.1 ABC transporter permease [Chitinophagaceae bacterium]
MALQELWKNKLRTFLSLFGITIGIFCIIGVLATVNSLEQNIQNEVKSLGTNTIYIDKWDYSAGGGPDYPWWKYVNRPVPKYDELKQIKDRTPGARFAAFKIEVSDKVDYDDNQLSNVQIYGITEEFREIQPIEVAFGRYLSDAEFSQGAPSAVIGNEIAEKLFGTAERAIGKLISCRGKKLSVIGVIKKQGKTMIGGWQFDQSVILSYRYARNIMDEKKSDPLMLVQGLENLSSKALKDDLSGTMRALHKLPPTKEDDFALNDINDFSDAISKAFVSLNMGGWAIAALSLIVGMFGVANIMFVSVRERTSQIGLKKAIGAKSRVILAEFLLESAFLCVIGGLIGLSLVYLLTQVLTNLLDFPVYISTSNMALAIVICIIVGILAGFIPARQAARMDPVVAIRSK